VYRDGALDHVTKLESAGGTGVWLPKSAADSLGISPGDEVQLALNGEVAQARVAGIYRDLSTQPRTDFWCQQDAYIYPLSAFDNFVPPPFVLADRQTFTDLGKQLKDLSARFTWEYLPRPRLTVAAAKDLGDRLLAQSGAAIRGNPFGNDYAGRFGSLVHIDARYPFLVDRAIATEGSLRGPVDTIGLAGRVVGLIVVAVAGVFWVDRRRSEVALLAAKGAGPFDFSVKVVLEVAIPAALAGAAGAIAARWLVRWLGPIDVFDAPALSDSNRQVIVTVAIAVLLFAVVAAVASRRILEVASPRRRDLMTSVPWELVLLALAGASLYEVLSRTPTPAANADVPPQVDRLVLLFPILFVTAGAGLAARLLRRVLPRLRSRGQRWPTPLWLASRRLSTASRTAVVLVIAASVSVGILAYSGILTTSVRATAQAKAELFTGADVAITLQSEPDHPVRFDFPTTAVTEIDRAAIGTGGSQVNVLAVDPGTFASAAAWDSTFGDQSLETYMSLIQRGPQGGRTPILAVGVSSPADTSIRLPGGTTAELPVRVVGTPHAFPGMQAGTPLLVIPKDALGSNPIGLDEIWARGDPQAILDAVDATDLTVVRTVTADDVASTADFLPISWTFGFLQALGILAGLIALGGALLHLEARQRAREVSYALARRMGLGRGGHRASVAIELSAILLVSVAIGTVLAGVAARLVFGRLDPLPNIPPPPLFRVPLVLLAITALVALVAAWIGAWRVQRAADHARVGEVMRIAG
jgi:putative ABC transport system permease protein